MKRLVSGIKPTGSITLGNYLGAIKNFVQLQKELKDTEMFIFVADLHALTIEQDRKELKENIKKVAALYIACGLDPEKVNLFIQSQVIEHASLGWIMESTAYVGEMKRMIQYKEKSQNQKEGIKSSLFTYPALMAADILLYDASFVPIGEDQKQHLELTTILAERFNTKYGDTFVIPKGIYPKTARRIMDLQNPFKKMSKSNTQNQKGYILLLDDLNQIKNKIRSAVTDSDNKIRFDVKNKPGISNLLNIYSALTNITIDEIVKKYKNSSYKEFKEDLANIVYDEIKPIQDKYKEIIKSPKLNLALEKGRKRASLLAKRKLNKVYHKIGLLKFE